MKAKFGYLNSLLLVAAAVLGTTTIPASSTASQVWADVIEGTEGDDVIVGTPGADLIDSKGGNDQNFGDAGTGDGSGNDIIASGEGDDGNTGHGGADIFKCGEGEDTVTDFNEAEGDIAAPDCENV
jgi:hypothetical protein